MNPIDLRSDTLTRPTPAMRRAMAEAEVGDDVYEEDPTVNRLQELAAEVLGFERALFLPTGTMANQVALLLHLRRGSEVLVPEGAHLYEYELGAPALLSGALVRPVPAPRGVPDLRALQNAIHLGPFQAPTGLLALENTHNLAGGTVVPLEVQEAFLALAQAHALPTHLDGARLHNAAAYLGVEPARLARGFTTAMVSLSKGLGAPVGSLLLLPKALEAEARRYRKLLGGGWRQAGVLAAAGLIALTEGPKLLKRDHEMARALAQGLHRLGLGVDLEAVQTNMVYVQVEDPQGFLERLEAHGVLAGAVGGRVRFVTHRDLKDEDIPEALTRIEAALQRAA
ncbi:threonine aldolase family protein [Thermus caliditerrae]|uniref:threonine aldolase family protein n=1 Tax=Thermus caliditerrae TaxID=1330700 RepID=UPI001F1EF611|nr:threonine aldolase family protein [Thermus caliditerrae]